MGIFSGSKKEGKLAVVFDIGSSSVGGALFFIQKSGVPKIIYSIREPITVEDKISPDRFLHLTLKSLEVVAAKICVSGLGAPKKIFCVLSSPWYASQTRIINLEKNTPFVFTTKLADHLIKKETAFLKDEHSSRNMKALNGVRHFEMKSMETLLNGYPTADPIGKKARELEMSILISMSAEQVLGQIEESVFKHFHSKDVKYSSFLAASYAVVRDLFVADKDFLLIDVGGEMTEVSMVKKEVLTESISFPMGRNFILREAGSKLNSSLAEVKSLMALHKDSHLHSGAHRKVEPALNKLKKDWLEKFQESLSHLSKNISIPSKIFVSVDKEMATFFTDAIMSEQFHQYSFTQSKFQVTVLSSDVLHGIATFGQETVRDPFLTMESVYINRFLSKNI